jgi:hypothetical protein
VALGMASPQRLGAAICQRRTTGVLDLLQPAAACMIRPTTTPSQSMSWSSSFHSPDGREADACLRIKAMGDARVHADRPR